MPADYISVYGEDEGKRRFLADYFDKQKEDMAAYREAGIQPRMIIHGQNKFAVPFKLKDSDKKDTEIAGYIFDKAYKKYNRAVGAARKLAEAKSEKHFEVAVSAAKIKEMRSEYDAYLWNKRKDNAKVMAVKIGNFLSAGAKFAIEGVGLSEEKLRKAAKKTLIGATLAGLTAIGGYAVLGAVTPKKNNSKDEKVKGPKTEHPEAIIAGEDNKGTEIFEAAQEVVANKKNVGAKKKTKPKAAGKATGFKRSAAELDKLFARYTDEIFASEGGYGDKKTIDQPTNMGIIEPTLKAFVKKYPKDAKKYKFPAKVKDLTQRQAGLIYRKNYFDYYRIGDYRNESIGMLVYDMYVNHPPASVKKFLDQAFKAARKAGADLERLPTTVEGRAEAVNNLAAVPSAEKAFYDMILKERRYHMYKKTDGKVKSGKVEKSRFGKGLKNRVNKFNEKFVATDLQPKTGNMMQFAAAGKAKGR